VIYPGPKSTGENYLTVVHNYDLTRENKDIDVKIISITFFLKKQNENLIKINCIPEHKIC
jgi:hypothetical protein